MGVNAAFNCGAIEHNGLVRLVVRLEGYDRKSFFALAESESGIDRFRFTSTVIFAPCDEHETNIYDMRLVPHEDGYTYGLFCSERHDETKPDDTSAAVASAGIVRTRDLVTWERLPNLRSHSHQQRNVVLHPTFVDGKYAFYTRPLDTFASTGSGAGICWGLSESITDAFIENETVIDPRSYHAIDEGKNGLGPAPFRTEIGWLHLAHGVRDTAAGLRYVLYLFLADLEKPWQVVKKPGGYFIAPEGGERVGDVSNVVFSNGWVQRSNGDVLIYYASSDTRLHVATSSTDRLLDYVLNTPEDGRTWHRCLAQRNAMISRNQRRD